MTKELSEKEIVSRIYDQTGVKPGIFYGIKCPKCGANMLASISVFSGLFAACQRNPNCIVVRNN